jgi:raffinose/stachyose/melibiose transport system permease protein
VVLGLLTVLGGIWLIPFVYMLDVSLRLPQDTFDSSLIVGSATLINFRTVIADNPLGQDFANSAIIAAATVLCVVAFSAAFSFAVSVLKVPYGRAMYSLILITLTIPIAALVVPLAVLLSRLGLLNNDLGLIGPYAALGIPFAVVILKGFMDSLSREVMEAASVDGVTAWEMFTRIVLPMLKPSLIFIAAWQFITSWNEFFLALVVMTHSNHFTLPLVPEQYGGIYLGNAGAEFAILVLIALPLIVVYVVIQRWFVAGLLEGAVK